EMVTIGSNAQPVWVLPFDLARAHELYRALLGPASELIKDKHLLIVPSGPLTGLSFNVLVTDPPKVAIPGKLEGYREVAWLGTRQPISVLPSVGSLRALREFAKTSRATKPYLGIGNPLLDGEPGNLTDSKRAQAALERQHCPRLGSQRIA